MAVTSLLSSFLLFWSRGGERPEAQQREDILGSGSNALSGEAAVKSSGSGSLQSLFVVRANKSSPSSSWVPNTDKVQTRDAHLPSRGSRHHKHVFILGRRTVSSNAVFLGSSKCSLPES